MSPPLFTRLLRSFVVFVALSAASAALAQGGPNPLFQKANKSFKEGKSKAAYKQLVAIVKKYPDHQPSHLLLGRIMYKNGRVNKAAKHFKKVSPDLISGADLAYEYGVSMFTAKDCKRSAAGFAKVPSQSKYASVASFYRGICAMRAGDLDKAEVLLNRAKKLPRNLESPKRQALAQIRKQQRSNRGGGGFNPYIQAPTPPPPPPPAYVDPGAPPPPNAAGTPAKKPPPPPPPPTGLTTTITPGVSYTQTTTNKDFHGLKTDRSESRASDVKLGLKFKYDAEPRDNGGQPYFSLGIDATQNTTSTKGVQTEFIAYANDPGTIIEQEKPATTTSSTGATATVKPEVGYPITGSIDVTAGYTLFESYPEMKAEAKTGSRGPYGALDIAIETLNLKGSGKQTESIDVKGQVTSTVLSLGGEASKSWDSVTASLAFQQDETTPQVKPPPGFIPAFIGTTQIVTASVKKTFDTVTGNVGVTNKTFTPPQGYVAASDDTQLLVTFSLTKTFEFGGSFQLLGAMVKGAGGKKQYDFPTDPANPPPPADPNNPAPPAPKDLITYETNAQSITVNFKIAPLEWLFASASYSQTTNAYTLNKPQYELQFQKETPEIVSTFVLSGGVSKTF